MQPTNAWNKERGSVAPLFLAVVSMMLILSWVAVEVVSAHFLSAARQTRDIQAGELARAGVEAALAEIDEGDTPPDHIAGEEETGTYDVTITPTGRGTYTVVSTGTVRDESKTITAEVSPAPEPFAILAGGDVAISDGGVAKVVRILTIDGNIEAKGNISLESSGGLLSLGSFVHVKGDVTAGQNVTLHAFGGLIGQAGIDVDGSVSAGQDVALEAKGLVGAGTVNVDGTVAYGGELHEEKTAGIITRGSAHRVKGVTVSPIREADTSYFEALVADLEAKGQMRQVDPENACGTIRDNIRVKGDLECGSKLKIENGAVVVVDGSVDVDEASVSGLLYVRGGATPNDAGKVNIGTLSLELILASNPVVGGGTVAATGDISVKKTLVARLLAFGSKKGTVLQVLALSTGSEDAHDDIDFGLGGLIEGLSGSGAAPLLLYAGGKGNIQIHNSELVGLINVEVMPMIAVAGGNVSIDGTGLASVVGNFTIKARPEIWKYAPPFLRGMGRSYVMSWEWTGS